MCVCEVEWEGLTQSFCVIDTNRMRGTGKRGGVGGREEEGEGEGKGRRDGGSKRERKREREGRERENERARERICM